VIYLASPYSHADAEVEADRFRQVCAKTAEIMRSGRMVFSPIAHSHPVMKHSDGGVGGDWESWARFDVWFIARCDELWVLMLDGYEESVGVQKEVYYAKSIGKAVRYITAEEAFDVDPA